MRGGREPGVFLGCSCNFLGKATSGVMRGSSNNGYGESVSSYVWTINTSSSEKLFKLMYDPEKHESISIT